MEPLYSCRNCILSLFSILLVILSTGAVSNRVTYEGESMVVEGNPFQIICKLTVFDTMKWQRNGVTLYTDENTLMSLSEDESGGGYIIGKLMIRKARDYHSGEYTCSSFGGPGHTVNVVGVKIVGNFDFDWYKVIEYKSTLNLQCNLTDESVADSYTVKWLKDDKPMSETSDNRVEIKPLENRFILSKALDTDAGNYSCVFTNKINNSELRLNFQVVFKPYVKLPPHTSVVEGEKLTLTCIILSDPVPIVYWKIGNKTYEDSDERVKLLENKEKGIPKSILQIEEANMDDRNTYTCGAYNIGNKFSNATESSTFVRVKDKLAALWPFLGICAEVVVLCTIILIYEKKRNKTELDESDTDGSPEQKTTPDHKKESEIRQRK
ncbi:Basigin precursor, putative [Pediculus humanus corporis]|uniref:Basigin, putative n=1 Tax=Pediculus humanus subsp. corporis TaxID=121224 RepID=E0VQ49_PEDHC|nr:Basigin precursor, putative [Pediculus humanus corporis]EEB15505.1 Basigin precursor, putative [Pediculus humanus corporis]